MNIVTRVSSDVAGSRIDMRSTSRQGRRDYGVNAARIRAYMGALRKRNRLNAGTNPAPIVQ